jgi:hypothetical protein
MSKIVKVLDPILDLSNNDVFVALKGGSQLTKRKYTYQTSSNSSCQLSFTTPSPYTFMSKKWMFKQPVTITFSGNSNDPNRNLLQSGQDSFRQYPLQSVMSVLDVKLNGTSSNTNVNDYIKAFLLYHNNSRNLGERELSTVPTARDQSQAYSQLDGSIRNPLASMYDSNQRDAMGRGGFPLTSFTNTTTSAVISADLTTELFLSPLAFGNNREVEGFVNLQDVELNITWDSNLSKMWSHSSSSSSTITSIDVQLGTPVLEVTYLTPPQTMSIPRSIDYPYWEIKRYPTSTKRIIQPGDSDIAISNNIQVGAIPRFLYVFLRKTNNTFTYEDTDSYGSIQQVKVDWDNQNALLSSATQEQLYDISRKNGVDMSWTEWSANDSYVYLGDSSSVINGIGSVLCLEFGTDIGLKDYECAGLRDTYNLSVEVQYKNAHPSDPIEFTLYLVTVIPGVFRIYDRSADRIVGVLSKQDVLNAKTVPFLDYEDLEKRLMSGSSKFAKKFKKYAPRVARTALKVARIGAKSSGHSELLPVINVAEKALKSVTKKRKSKKGSSLVGGRKKKVGRPRKRKAGSMVGGEYMSKKQLLDRLMSY